MKMIIGTTVAWGILVPIHVAHLFILFPDNMNQTLQQYGNGHVFELVQSFPVPYTYDNYSKFFDCGRIYIVKSWDYNIIVYTILALNILAVVLTGIAFYVIAYVITQNRAFRQSRNAAERRRRQNRALGFRALIYTTCIFMFWLPNLLVSLAMELVGNVITGKRKRYMQ